MVEYVDCSNPGIHAARWWQVLENLAVRCGHNLKREFKHDAKIVGGYGQANAGTQFTTDMKNILSLDRVQQIILMLDEVEYITHGLSGALGQHWDEDFVPFWQTIRATHQETLGRFTFIVAGVNPICVEEPHFGTTPNPIFQLAVPHYLAPFTVAGVREMVRSIGRYTGLQFDEEVYPYLQATYGGHPFLIRIACSEIWKATDTRDPQTRILVTVQHFERLQPIIQDRMAQPIKDILLSLVWWYPEVYELLQILAEGDATFVHEYLKDQPKSMIQFARYGILKEDNTGEFAISDLREFIRKHGATYKKEISPFTRGDMPPELLPEVPDLNLLGVLFQQRSEIEIKLRHAIMLYLGYKFTWDQWKIATAIASSLQRRSDRRDPKELFVGRTPADVMKELYTLDLKSIVLAHWDVFGPLFDNQKARFEMNMDTLNIARRVDAHTKPVTPEEKLEFENSYAWLLTRLAKIPGV